MARSVVLVSDGGPIPPELKVQSSWRHILWDTLSAQPRSTGPADLVILVGPADHGRAVEGFEQLAARPINSRVLAILDRNSPPNQIDLAFAVADDLLLCPEREEVVQQRIHRLTVPAMAEFDSAYEGLIATLGQVNLVGRAPEFLRIAEKIPACARADFAVLITGETGTGKELFARAVHFMSRRRNHPFVPVDCGGIPDHLFENELFGHVRGAYTDAHGDQKGLAALAEGGTLFLDEIDSLSPGAQSKFLRFLQERQYKPLGAERYARADIKLVAATNGSLEDQVREKRFREDLYFRLNVLRLDLPPLRERPGDIALLAEHFLATYCAAGERRSFTPAALQQMRAYSWPGNVRELLNAVQRAIVFSQTRAINACDIVPRIQPAATDEFRKARAETLQNFERSYVEEMLRQHDGNVTRAARAAGKERRAFGKLVKKYGLAARTAAGRS